MKDIPRKFSGFVNAPLLSRGHIIYSHQLGGTYPLSYNSLNRQFIKGHISFHVHLNISIQIPLGPGDQSELYRVYIRYNFFVTNRSPKSLQSYLCLIFHNKVSFWFLTSVFSRFLEIIHPIFRGYLVFRIRLFITISFYNFPIFLRILTYMHQFCPIFFFKI